MSGFVYTAGGTVPADVAKTYRYDPVANTWDDASIADLPVTRWGAASDAYNGGWLLAGGYVNGNVATSISNSALWWNPNTNTWTEYGPMTAARARMGAASAAGSFYAVGGRGAADGDPFAGHTDNQREQCTVATPTPTATPAANILVGHVTYQGIAQPYTRNLQAITLTLCVGGVQQNYVTSTDTTGHFTVTLTLPTGNYNYKVKSFKNLSNGGTLTLNAGTTNMEFGTLRAGDANNNDIVNTTDFTLLKNAFGTSNNLNTDFNNDGITNTTDFTLSKG